MDQQENPSFLKNHTDTLAIIIVNIAIAAILVTMIMSQTSRIDAANARIDATYNMIYAIIDPSKIKGK